MSFMSILSVPFGYVLPFIIALTIIVFIHELGHFLVARWCGVKVEIFSIGFGREIFGWNDRHATHWKVCWLPFGGYVKFEGDANAASLPQATHDPLAQRSPGNFHGKKVWQRALVVAAGPCANFLLAIAIFTGVFAFIGLPMNEARVLNVLPGSAADKAGIKGGDLFTAVDGQKIETFSDDMKFPISSTETKTLNYKQTNIHDFAWFADKRFHILKSNVILPNSKKNVTTWIYFTNVEADLWKNAINYVNNSVYYYSKWNGEYPYETCTAIDGTISAGGGMEYPTITVIGKESSDFSLEDDGRPQLPPGGQGDGPLLRPAHRPHLRVP